VVVDAEVRLQVVPGVVGDGAGADVLDLVGGVEGDVAAAGELEVHAAQGVAIVEPVEQVGVSPGEHGAGRVGKGMGIAALVPSAEQGAHVPSPNLL
jgi:hypothetical protein